MLRASLLTATYMEVMSVKQNKISYQVRLGLGWRGGGLLLAVGSGHGFAVGSGHGTLTPLAGQRLPSFTAASGRLLVRAPHLHGLLAKLAHCPTAPSSPQEMNLSEEQRAAIEAMTEEGDIYSRLATSIAPEVGACWFSLAWAAEP